MLKQLHFSFLFSLIVYSSQAQFDTSFAKKNINRCADSLVKGFRTKNWELFALYSNPAIIGTMGGKQEFIRFVNQTFATIPTAAWKKYNPGKILQVISTPNELQSVSELNSLIEWDGKRITSTTFLIGQSWDGGLNWTFFDSQSNIKAVKTIKPDISPDIIIPAKKEKVEFIDENGKVVTPPKNRIATPEKSSGRH